MKKTHQSILKLIFIYISLFASGSHMKETSSSFSKQSIAQFVHDSTKGKDNNISGLSYNVWGLPIWVPGQSQSFRFERIADSILVRDIDIVCLQEIFNKKVRRHLIKKLVPHYFSASDYSCNQPIIGSLLQKDCHGGLMTLSKFPIMEESFYKFTTSRTTSFIEKIGGKGFLFTTILWNGQPINIINTHLYSGTSQLAVSNRMNQILEMEQILKSHDAYKLYPSLLFGDLNVTHPFLVNCENLFNSTFVYEYLTTQMEFIDTQTVLDENSFTINSDLNVYSSANEEKQKLDYIMVHLPQNATSEIWLENQHVDFYGQSALSDHMGWRVQINIDTKNTNHNNWNKELLSGM